MLSSFLSGAMTRQPDGIFSKILTGKCAIPASAAGGTTRMRVSMKRGAAAKPCELLPPDEGLFIFSEPCDSCRDFGRVGRPVEIQVSDVAGRVIFSKK